MLDVMLKKLKAGVADGDEGVRVVMVSGNGGKSFCAGGDIVEYFEHG